MSEDGKSYGKRILATAAIYVAAAWAAVEALLTVVDRFGLPQWWGNLIMALFVAGLPVTVYLVWRTAGAERKANAASIIGSILFLIVATAGIFMAARPEPLPAASAVAIVPCEFAGQSEYAYRAEGLAEDVHARLSRVDSVKISSWNSSLFVRDKGYDPGQIAELLKVDRLVRCRMTSDAERIALSAEVLDPAADTVLWNHDYDFASSDLGTVVIELAGTLLDVLGTTAQAAELEQVNDLGTFSPEAYDLYLQAWDSDNPEALINQALEIDPNYAQALQFLAEIKFDRAMSGEFEDVSEPYAWATEARTLSQKALELNPAVLGARLSIARVCRALGNYYNEPCPPGEPERLAAEECEIRGDTAEGWACRHAFDVGVDGMGNGEILERWLELEPTSWGGNVQLIAHIWLKEKQPAEALVHFDTLRALFPDDPKTSGIISNMLRNEGRLDEVLAWRYGSFGDQVPEGRPWLLARLGTDYMDLGLYDQALEIGLKTWETRRASATHFLPQLWARLGEPEKAAEAMEWQGQFREEMSGSKSEWLQVAFFYINTLRYYQRGKELSVRALAGLELKEACETSGGDDCRVMIPLALAQAERALGNDELAAKWQATAGEAAADMDPDDDLGAMLAIALGRHAEAVEMLRKTVFSWGDEGGEIGLPIKLNMLENAALFDPLRGLPEFQQLIDDYRAHLEPLQKRVLETERSGDWESLRQRTYQWAAGENG
jgi:TolB-like protein